MKYKTVYLFIFVWGWISATPKFCLSQASQSAFNFIENPSFTKLAGLGGVNLTAGSDPLMFTANPALLDSSGVHIPSFQYLHFPGGINVATVGYNFYGIGNGVLGIGLQYFDYGKFDGYDDVGIATGEFNANEFALILGYGLQQGIFNYGANVKLLGSVLEGYQAYAIAFDLGVNLKHPEHDLVVGILARNIGFGIKNYLEGESLQLPSDLRVGGSFKPPYAPFRIHLALRNLQGREVDFYIPDPFKTNEGLSFPDKLFRRMVIGIEAMPTENFHLRLGYNHLIRKEFKASTGAGAGGFSGGFAFKVKKFELSYSRMFYNVPGGSNIFGITSAILDKRTF